MKSITQETKERIFALYWGQKICVDAWHLESDPGSVDAQFLHYSYYERNHPFLLLKPLSAITFEDSVKLSEKGWSYCKPARGAAVEVLPVSEWKTFLPEQIDFLRSRGYALPAFGYTVDELIEAGVFKLKQ